MHHCKQKLRKQQQNGKQIKWQCEQISESVIYVNCVPVRIVLFSICLFLTISLIFFSWNPQENVKRSREEKKNKRKQITNCLFKLSVILHGFNYYFSSCMNSFPAVDLCSFFVAVFPERQHSWTEFKSTIAKRKYICVLMCNLL